MPKLLVLSIGAHEHGPRTQAEPSKQSANITLALITLALIGRYSKLTILR